MFAGKISTMIRIINDQSSRTSLFVIEANRSLSWQKILWIYIVISTVCISIALIFALNGFWVILPFAGLEVLLLGIGLILTFRRCSFKEVIKISEDALYIEKGRLHPEKKYKFLTAWVRVTHSEATLAHYPSRLTIGSHGNEVEVGAELTEDDRKSLARELKKHLASYGL